MERDYKDKFKGKAKARDADSELGTPCNPSAREPEAGGLAKAQGQPSLPHEFKDSLKDLIMGLITRSYLSVKRKGANGDSEQLTKTWATLGQVSRVKKEGVEIRKCRMEKND